MKCALGAILFLLTTIAHGQAQQRVDSLLAILTAQAPDTNKVLTLLALGDTPDPSAPSFTVENRTVQAAYIEPALALARRLNWERGEAMALFLGSIAFEQQGGYGAALARLDSAVRMSSALRERDRCMVLLRASLLHAITQVDLPHADSLALAAASCYEACKLPQEITASMEARARVKMFQRDWVSAIAAYYRTIDHGEEHASYRTLAIAYEKVGVIMGILGDPDRASIYFAKSVHLSDSLGTFLRSSMGYDNWGANLLRSGHAAEAIPLFNKALGIAKQNGLRGATVWSPVIHRAEAEIALGRHGSALRILDSIPFGAADTAEVHLLKGECALALGRFSTAVEHCHQAMSGQQFFGKASRTLHACNCLMGAYRGIGDIRSALEWSIAAQQWADSVTYAREAHAVTRTIADQEYGHRIMADSLAHASELALGAAENQRQRTLRNGAGAISVALAFCAVVFLFQRIRIARERRRSEELLLNILPEEVAEELKDTGAAQAKHFDNATILFSDFKGFTLVSEQLSPQELVEELNVCFKAFDQIITARGIEKIKTIGDAYMCAGGLPDPKSSSPADVVHAALEMQAFMRARKVERDAQGKPAFEMRVGIHTGPVVAGIVGVKKFQYDIWGDTVNTASRMESSGEVGQVNISESTYALVKNEPGLSFTPRGKVQAKGKGEMEMYFVGRM